MTEKQVRDIINKTIDDSLETYRLEMKKDGNGFVMGINIITMSELEDIKKAFGMVSMIINPICSELVIDVTFPIKRE